MLLDGKLREFYRSSPMREGILCWYPFERGAKVLDLSGGALSDLLASRCGCIKNAEIDEAERFDYVVVIDSVDFSVESLKGLRERLNSHGRLLFAFENPFALRYWSGKSSPITHLPYSSILGRDGRAGKAELQIRLSLAGFEGQKWYYPLTDHWFTREVYSEGFLPDEYLNQRFVPYIAEYENLQFDERLLYREVIRGGAFEFMCGAYLVEARACAEDAPCPVDYAAVTAYREPAKRFATTVRNDGFVHKIPLHRDGHKQALTVLRNHEELAKLGVSVVPMRFENGVLVMPRLALPTLWDYWVRKLSDGTFDYDEMTCHFDKIRDAIYRASANGKCFWELVPANCFYDAQKDGLIFFDQEYRWENHPPETALVRALGAIKYSNVLSVDQRSGEWLETLTVRYGLSDLWDELFQSVTSATHAEVFGSGTAALEAESAKASETILKRTAMPCTPEKFRPVPDKLRTLGYRRPIVYGYGRRGKKLVPLLSRADMEPAAIVDREIRAYSKIEQMPPEVNSDVIVVSVLDSAAIVEDLKTKTALPIFTLEELLNE